MIKNTHLWLVAILASSLSFIFIVISIVLSNFFQQNIFNLNAWLLNQIPNDFISYYTRIITSLNDLTAFINEKVLQDASKIFGAIALCIIVIFFDLGITEFFSFKLSISGLFKSLKEVLHPTRNINILFWTIRIFFWITTILFSISWYNTDHPMMMITFSSIVITYILGVVYNMIYKKWKKNNFKSK